jgi:hypothetical protein
MVWTGNCWTELGDGGKTPGAMVAIGAKALQRATEELSTGSLKTHLKKSEDLLGTESSIMLMTGRKRHRPKHAERRELSPGGSLGIELPATTFVP